MDKRLLALAEKVPSGTGVIDVGTDHGYIPVYLALHGYSGNILASDIHAAPLRSGMLNAKVAGVEDMIGFLLCDGLEKCPPSAVDTVLIAGMGGEAICGILDRAEWIMQNRYLLILQPMTKAEVLRYWLVNNGFVIVSEELCEETGHIYPILTARFGGKTELNDAELFTGKYELIYASPLFRTALNRLIYKTEKSIAGLECSSGTEKLAWKKLLMKVHCELSEMRERSSEDRK